MLGGSGTLKPISARQQRPAAVKITLTTLQRQSTTARANNDVDMYLFYNQIKSVPGFLIEPYYVLYSNRLRLGGQPGPGSRDGETLEPDPS